MRIHFTGKNSRKIKYNLCLPSTRIRYLAFPFYENNLKKGLEAHTYSGSEYVFGIISMYVKSTLQPMNLSSSGFFGYSSGSITN